MTQDNFERISPTVGGSTYKSTGAKGDEIVTVVHRNFERMAVALDDLKSALKHLPQDAKVKNGRTDELTPVAKFLASIEVFEQDMDFDSRGLLVDKTTDVYEE